MLSDVEIRKLIQEVGLIEGMTDSAVQIQPCGVDLTLDYVEEPARPKSGPTIIDFSNKRRIIAPMVPATIYKRDVYEVDSYTFTEPLIEKWYELRNSEYVFHTREKVKCPQNISGFMLLRSSLTRGGITCTTSLIDPGYYGHLTLAVNVPPSGLHIFLGARFAQVVFFRLGESAAGVYNGVYKEIVK